MLKDGDMIEDTKSAIVLEDLIGKFLYSQSLSGRQYTRNQGVTMFKKIALLLGLMTSMLFSLVAWADVNTSDPYALVDQAAQQTFARLKADQAQVKSNPDHLRVIIREELLPYGTTASPPTRCSATRSSRPPRPSVTPSSTSSPSTW